MSVSDDPPADDARAGAGGVGAVQAANLALVYGGFSGDGHGDAAAVATCNAGGVEWPQHVLLYGPGPRLLGDADLSTVHNAEHADVEALTASGPDLRVTWSTAEGCCSDMMTWSARLHFDGTRLQILDATRTG